MLNWFIAYSIVLSFVYRLHYHHKVVAPGNGVAILKWAAMAYVRGVCITAIILIGSHQGIFGPGYAEWWNSYITEHSMVVWVVLTLPVTIALYIVKEATYYVMKDPGHYQWYGDTNAPSLCRINMAPTLVWNTVFWSWMLLSPWLPFSSCFLRVFLLKTPASAVFPYM